MARVGRPEGGADGSPFISVLVTAHDRRKYLRGAVENLLAQSLSRRDFEILVVKNFEDPEVDRFLDDLGIVQWVTSAGPLAEKVVEGLSRARGRVLTFLEDDDRYDPERLAAVASAFRTDPNLGFYRNGFEVIDEDDRPFSGWLPDAVRRSHDRARDFRVPVAEKDRSYRALMETYPDFNSSTMAIRRDILASAVPFLRRITAGVDRFLFHVGLAANGTIALDARPLTRYRFHPGNTGIAGVPAVDLSARLDRIMASDRTDEAVIDELLHTTDLPTAVHELGGRRLVLEIDSLVRCTPTDRRRMAGNLLRVPRYRRTQPLRANRRLGLEGAVYLLSPSAARRLHQRRVAKWLRRA